MRTLLCVEDDLQILRNNREALTESGYAVRTAENLAQARAVLSKDTPDAILLDIMLPDGNGLDLLQELRSAGNKVPVIMLTAWGEPKDVSRGYRLGATAYLSKPFDYEAVEAAVESIFGQMEQVPELVQKGVLTLNLTSMIALLGGENMKLTQKEFFLLLLFVRNEGKILRAEYLYEKVWGQIMNDDKRTLKKHVSELRKRLKNGHSGYAITVKRGEGYCFERVI
jgi:DNA-binding response OmpR family regulator